VVVVRVPDGAAGTRLDRFLAGLGEIGTRAAAERLLTGSGVTVDGRVRPKSHRLEGGEEVAVEVAEPEAAALRAEELPLRIAYEDEHLLVVDKPAGIVVHPSPGHPTGTLVHGLLGRTAGGDEPGRPGIVHRLDQYTSGLLVVARTEETFERLQELVRRRQLERRYKALVRGRPRSWKGRVEAPIGRDRHDPTRHSLDTDAPREAVTHFEVERLLDRHALLDVRLETGRTHQIRVHLAAIGHPLAGDWLYGERNAVRPMLHAAELEMMHPLTNEPLRVAAPVPEDFREEALRRGIRHWQRTGPTRGEST